MPRHYDGEQPFLSFDDGFWLNRVMTKILDRRESRSPVSDDDELVLSALGSSEVEVTA